MEVNITKFAKTADLPIISGSCAELGQDAARFTWNNAKEEARHNRVLRPDQYDEFRRWIKGFGAWSESEIAAWTHDECNALLLQFIAGDLRELQALAPSDEDEFGIDWKEAERLSQEGTVSGRIFKGDDDQLYIYIGD